VKYHCSCVGCNPLSFAFSLRTQDHRSVYGECRYRVAAREKTEKNRINSRLPVAQHYSVAPRPCVISSYTLTGLICRIRSPRATTKLTRKLQLSMTVKRFSVQCSLQHDICPSFDCPPAVEAHRHCIECNQGYSIPIVIIP